jgi:hypothetical protein
MNGSFYITFLNSNIFFKNPAYKMAILDFFSNRRIKFKIFKFEFWIPKNSFNVIFFVMQDLSNYLLKKKIKNYKQKLLHLSNNPSPRRHPVCILCVCTLRRGCADYCYRRKRCVKKMTTKDYQRVITFIISFARADNRTRRMLHAFHRNTYYTHVCCRLFNVDDSNRLLLYSVQRCMQWHRYNFFLGGYV